MSEILIDGVVLAIPGALGYIVARYCTHHCLVLAVLLIALGVFWSVGSVPYGAFSFTIATSFCAVIGYFVGRLSRRR
jgi:hypothetical protein